MKIKTLTYAMLRQTKQFENDRVEVTVELGANDKVSDAVKEAKAVCEKALATSTRGY